MKKKIFCFLFMMLIMPVSVLADSIYKVDMRININEDGNASVEEIWDVKANSGSEWYKTMYELNNSELTDFKVYMDSEELTYKNYWNINGSLEDKRGYYGINHTSKGIELCFGKSDYKHHIFTVQYKLSNYVFNVEDSQVLAWVLMPKITLDNFTVEVSSYYDFPDTLDVWGYGYKGYAYVENGKIKMSNEGRFHNDYISLLVKFPLGTFKTDNRDYRYNTFDDVYRVAEEGTFEYDYGDSSNNNNVDNHFSFIDIILGIINFIFSILPFLLVLVLFAYSKKEGYGYRNNKKIYRSEVPMFRDIPCNKDMYYANALIRLNKFCSAKGNILGAIILKWVKNNKIIFRNEKKGIFNRETSTIDLTLNPVFENEKESELFEIMYDASKDGLLEPKELEKWCSKHYSKFLSLLDSMYDDQIKELKDNNHIYKRHNREECSKKYVLDDKIYEDSVQLYGLKKYLIEFSNIDTKEVMDVHLWDEYLMFAYLFGIADKVARQLKNMYPEIMEQVDIDLDTLMYINYISTNSVSAASSARSAANSYSSGGGGFSSGGGGGFSGGFSGGGGGSAGGR